MTVIGARRTAMRARNFMLRDECGLGCVILRGVKRIRKAVDEE